MAAFNRRDLKELGILDENSGKNKSYTPNIKWTIRDVIFSVIFLVAILTGIYLLSSRLAFLFNNVKQISINSITNTSFSVLYGIQILLMVGVVWFFAVYWRRSSFKDLGFRYYSVLKTLWYSFLALLLIIFINFAYVFLIAGFFKISPPDNKIAGLIENKNVSSVILLIVVSVIGPICEELFFRGFIFQAFRKEWGVFAGLFISSFLFAAAHLELYNFLPLMAIGWVLAYIFHKTKSLFPVIFLHAVYNLLMILILFGQFNKITI